MRLTPKMFSVAVEHCKKNNIGKQIHLAEFNESSIDSESGMLLLCYDPFAGNWRLTNQIILATVSMDRLGFKLD